MSTKVSPESICYPITRQRIADLMLMDIATLRKILYDQLGIHHSNSLRPYEVEAIRDYFFKGA